MHWVRFQTELTSRKSWGEETSPVPPAHPLLEFQMRCLSVCIRKGHLRQPWRRSGAGAFLGPGAPTCTGRVSAPLEWPVSCSLAARSPPAPNSLGSTWDGGKRALHGCTSHSWEMLQEARGESECGPAKGVRGQGARATWGLAFSQAAKMKAKVAL